MLLVNKTIDLQLRLDDWWIINWKGCGRKRSYPDRGIFLDEMRKTMRNLSEQSVRLPRLEPNSPQIQVRRCWIRISTGTLTTPVNIQKDGEAPGDMTFKTNFTRISRVINIIIFIISSVRQTQRPPVGAEEVALILQNPHEQKVGHFRSPECKHPVQE
jgi:hypothetical protein